MCASFSAFVHNTQLHCHAGEPVLNQMSFFLVFAVLLDTLLIRTVVVPCCMMLIGLDACILRSC